MQAEIIAVGPFSKKIKNCLDYRSELYENTNDGSIITVRLFGMIGSNTSREFASLLGITNPWDFNQHKINIESINFVELEKFVYQFEIDYGDDLQKLLVLKDNGFEFHFRPQG